MSLKGWCSGVYGGNGYFREKACKLWAPGLPQSV